MHLRYGDGVITMPTQRAQNLLSSMLMAAGVAVSGSLPAVALADLASAEVVSDAIADAAGRILPAVVNVSATHIEEAGSRRFHSRAPNMGPWGELFRPPMDEGPQNREAASRGSGFFIDREGYVLTNNHVVDGADTITLTTHDKHQLNATVVGTDPKTDIALLKVDSDYEIEPAVLGSSADLRVGQWAIAIGNPFADFEGTVTFGIVSASGRSALNFGGGSPTIQDYIQTDASINPGNSGGPLANIRGEVIGINAAISSPSGGNVGIGFAIPVDLVKEVLSDLKTYGEVRRAFLGVNIQEVDGNLADALGLDEASGVLVSSVIPEGPAESGGLEEGDVIVEFNGQPIATIPRLQRLVASADVGSKAKVGVIRDGERKSFKVELAPMDEDPGQRLSDSGESTAGKWLGLDVVALDSPRAQPFESEATAGVLIVEVDAGSSGARGHLQPGYVIQKLGSHKIAGMADFRQAIEQLEERDEGKPIVVHVLQRGGFSRFFALVP